MTEGIVLWCSLYCTGNQAATMLDIGDVIVPVCDQCLYTYTPIKSAQNIYSPALDAGYWGGVDFDEEGRAHAVLA